MSTAIGSLPTSTGGATLAELSQERPVFVVLLRHCGCTFHREALADLKEAQAAIEEAGARLAIVHMGADENTIEAADDRYDLSETTHVADPQRQLYKELGIPRGRLGQLFGWREFARGFNACIIDRHGAGTLKGDGLQLGGLALVDKGEVVWKRPLERASERPDYAAEARAAMAKL